MELRHKGILKPDGSIELVDDPFVWAEWMEYSPDKILRQDEAAGFFVSTIFFGVDLGYGKRPIWFETMVFRQTDDDQPAASRPVTQERYSTRHEALAGHQRILEAVRSGEIGE